MKKLNAIHFSAAKELTKGEQKNLKGGTEGVTVACQCTCHDVEFGTSHVNAEWTAYTSTGDCSTSHILSMINQYCYSGGTCVDIP